MSATRHKRKISWNSNATYYHPQLGLPDKKVDVYVTLNGHQMY